MLFADEPRFYADKQGISINDETLLLGRTMTEDHLGPGAYYTSKNDERRGKWTPRSPDKNARPQSSTFKSRDINHSVTNGIIVDDLYVHQPSSNRDLPGPGYYTPRERRSSKGFGFTSTAEMNKVKKDMSLAAHPMSPKSPRLTPHSATMRDGILCYSHEQKTEAGGPGYYYKNESTLIKKSFNVRVGRKEPLKQAQPLSPSSNRQFRSSAGFPVSPIKRSHGSSTAFMTPDQR